MSRLSKLFKASALAAALLFSSLAGAAPIGNGSVDLGLLLTLPNTWVPLQTFSGGLSLGGVTYTALGTAATVNTGTSGAAIPLLNGRNTFSGVDSAATGVSETFTSASAGVPVFLQFTDSVSLNLGVGMDAIGNFAVYNARFPGQVGNKTFGVTTAGAQIIPKTTAPTSAPGAGFAYLFIAAGTNSGTCKIQIMAGTSTTPITIVDNVGAGC